MIERLKYWLFQRGKDCYHCCLRCEYFDICRWDVITGKTAEQEQTVELLAVEAARKNGNTGLLYRIYKYVEFKKGERRKHEKILGLTTKAGIKRHCLAGLGITWGVCRNWNICTTYQTAASVTERQR